MKPGPLNLITDVAGLRVGHAGDERLKSGVTVLTADAPLAAGVNVMGGAPGTRETDLLAPDRLVQAVDALVLSGGRTRAAVTASALDKFAETAAQVPYIIFAAVIILQGWRQDWGQVLPSVATMGVIGGGLVVLAFVLWLLLQARGVLPGSPASVASQVQVVTPYNEPASLLVDRD